MRTNKNEDAIMRHLEDDDLISHLDGELSPDEQGQSRLHLESCWSCRSRLNAMQSNVENFVRLRHNVLMPEELPPSGPAQDLFRHRLSQHISATHSQSRVGLGHWLAKANRRPLSGLRRSIACLSVSLGRKAVDVLGHRKVWRPVAVAAVLLVLLAPIAWILFAPHSSVSADEVLKEAGLRERAWEFQPNKVLHWVIESDKTNHPNLPDGRYVAHHWRNNYPGQGIRLIRSYDQKGNLAYAIWDRPDGSSVLFSHVYPDQVSILPTRAEWQQAINKTLSEEGDRLEPDSRKELEARLKEAEESAGFYDPSRLFELTVRYVRRSMANATLEVVQTPEAGKTYRIRSERMDQLAEGGTMRHVMEQDIAADTLMRFRMKETRYLPSGKTAVTNSRWTLFEETSVADLEAHDLRDLMSSKRIVRRTPEELIKKMIRYKSKGT